MYIIIIPSRGNSTMSAGLKLIAKNTEISSFKTLKTLYRQLDEMYWELEYLDNSHTHQLNRMKQHTQYYRREITYSIRERIPEVFKEMAMLKEWIRYEKNEIDRVRSVYLDKTEYEEDEEYYELYNRDDEDIEYTYEYDYSTGTFH
jgi:hypothetical protein